MMPKKIVLFYGHVASNIGDLAINRGQVDLIKRVYPEATIQVVLLDAEKNEFLQSSKSSFGNEISISFTYLNVNAEKALRYHAHPSRLLDDCCAADADMVVLASGEHLFAYSRPENLKSIYWRTIPALSA
jgi:polysaccharide pyruvyl transferase WcaK-like protein